MRKQSLRVLSAAQTNASPYTNISMKSFDLARINHHTLQKHHLTDSSHIEDIPKIVSDIGGLHATGSIPPYLSLFARHPQFNKAMLEEELYEMHTLAKIRCVRKTIYIHPREMLPVYHQATQRILEKASKAFMVRQGVSQKVYASLVKKVLRAVSREELSTKQLKEKLKLDWNISPLLYYMCDQGLLVRKRPVGGWRDKNHRYAPFHSTFPDLDLESLDEEQATLALLRHYLRAFGPASMTDMYWWTDVGKTRVNNALEAMGNEVITLSISELEGSFYMLHSELEVLEQIGPPKTPNINLLPYLDPYIMGYKDRQRYMGVADPDLTFDRAGNAAPLILVDGMIAGVWDYEEKGGWKIKLHFFKKLPDSVTSIIEAKAFALGKFIADEEVEVKICDSMVPFSERTVGSFMSPLKG